MALLMQKVILPLLPEMHAGHGLLMNDAIVFHNMAVDIATRIHAHGWSEWSLFPPGATGNVGLLAAIYALLGPDPAWFIPFNAAAHVTGALLIYRLGTHLWSGHTGKLGGLLAGIAFLVFPSALQWYGQNHKDAFAIAGILLVLYAWLEMYSYRGNSLRSIGMPLLFALLGAMLLGVVRPYYVVLLVAALLASFLATLLPDKNFRTELTWPQVIRLFGLIVMVMLVALFFSQSERSIGVYGEDSYHSFDSTSTHWQSKWQWHSNDAISEFLEKPLRRASELRAHFVAFGRSVSASSEIDGDRLPNDSLSAIAYFPRALFVGLFAPFPDSWGERMTPPRLIGAMETAIWYVFAIGVAVLLFRRPSRKLLAGMVFCATLLVVLSYIHPNVGTLYRQRYGLWHFFLLCGSVGWASLILAYLDHRCTATTLAGQISELGSIDKAGTLVTPSSADRLAASGALVIAITLLCYLGFFARDLMLIKQLGMTHVLDAFFTAAMISMFFVTCLAMPMADALTMPFLSARGDIRDEMRKKLVQHQLGFALILLGGITLAVVAAAPYLTRAVLGNVDSEQLASSASMLRWFAPIILLSAWTVVGNAVLNALGRQRNAALGQLFVPLLTIGALVSASADKAMPLAIFGILAGTMLNVLWVVVCLRRSGMRFIPVRPRRTVLEPVMKMYLRLAPAAVLPAILVPLNYAFAAHVTSGAISAWAFTSKIVVLFSGLASVGATAVVLPHLVHLLAKGTHGEMRTDAKLLLVIGSWVGGMLALGAFLFAKPLVAVTLSNNLSEAQVIDLANILKVGVLQLPIAICGALIMKMAIVSGASTRVMSAAMLGFAGNLLVNMLLVPKLGVLGVAIGVLAATLLSTLLLLMTTYRQIGLTLKELLILPLSWLIWSGVCIAVVTGSIGALVSAVIAIAVMASAQFNLLRTSCGTSVIGNRNVQIK
ncbi:MAG TPA: lipid II flippase MurJ [Methylophilaceae bacterium]|nr:lipid II flippase MurJ [Methylophilaceae bacterium]